MSKVKISGNASGTGIFTVASPATNTDRTITLPDTSATLLAPDSTGSIQLDFAGSNNYLKFISSANYIGRNSSTGDIWLNAQGGQSVILGISGATQLKVDGNGRIITPSQPAFDAYGTVGNQLFTTDTPMPLNSTTYNVGGHYNTSTYRFTAPVAGIYFFRAQAYKQASGNASRLRLYKNASDVRVYHYSDATGTITHHITGIISLAAGDYVTCNFNSDGAGTNVYLADNHTNFSGYLLG